MHPLLQWKAAKARLTEALHHYLQCCIDLDSAASYLVSSFPNSVNPTDHDKYEINTLDVDAEIRSIKSLESKLSASHALLYRLHNTLPSHVRIAVLPPEILVYIFSLAMSPSICTFRDYKGPDTILSLLSVCTGWRNLAIKTSFFWSHVDVGGCVRDEATTKWRKLLELQLTRAAHAPIYLHVRHFSFFQHTRLPKLAQILEPYLDSLASLELSLDESTSALPLKIFQRFARTCTPGSARTLALASHSSSPHNGMLFSYLNVVEGLDRLDLHKLPSSVISTFDQLAMVISKNGTLRSLRLGDLKILPTDQTRRWESISLPRLELLDLDYLNPQASAWLLSILVPGDSELKLRLEPSDSQDMISASIQFLRRSKVTALYAYADTLPCRDWFDRYSPFLQHLRVLFLHSDQYLSFVKYDKLALSNPATRFPSLRTVCLVDVEFTKPSLQPLQKSLKLYSLRKLIFVNCVMLTRQDSANLLQCFSECAREIRILNGRYDDAGEQWESSA